jgi:hypothetical protein
MKKWVISAILVILTVLTVVMLCSAQDESGFAVGPAQLYVTVPSNGSNSTYIYITSYVDGELVVGMENLEFSVEPTTIPITSADRNRKVEVTVYGNTSLATGQYSGKLTLLFYSGSNVAHGVKISMDVTQEGPESQPSWLDQLIEIIAHNWVVIVAVAGIIVALTLGVYIGRKSKKNV